MSDTAWHEWRALGIGGSDVPAILGLTSFGSALTVWATKRGYLQPSDESDRQRIGKRFEAPLAAEFHDATGFHIAGEQAWCRDEQQPHRRCTVDGFVVDHNGTPVGVWECKTDGRPGLWNDADGVPASIKAQAIWNAGVTRNPGTWLTVMHAGFRIEHLWVPYDHDDFQFMAEAVDRFWFDHVLTDTPPAGSALDAETEALRAMFPGTPGTTVEIDPEIHVRWSEARDARLDAEKAEAAAANDLRLALGDAEVGTIAGVPVITCKATPAEQIDPRAERTPKPRKLAVGIPERAQRFYNPEPTRTLRAATTKERHAA